MSARILVVEDDPKLGLHLTDSLTRGGLPALLAESASALEDMIGAGREIDLVVLDRLLGSIDSKTYVPRIKRVWPRCRILMLSAINTPNERTDLLDLGADDYMGKPFATMEVAARVRALIRRNTTSELTYLKLGNTVVDLARRTASAGGKETPIPSKEFLLLKTLLAYPGRVTNKLDLLESVWGSSPETETNVVEATIANLRKRLQDIGSDLKIKNMRNAGYWIED